MAEKNALPTDKEEKPKEPVYGYHHKKTWLVPVLIVVIVVLFIGMIASWAAYRHNWYGPGYKNVVVRSGGHMMMDEGHRGGFWGGTYSNQNRISGVVTSVNGSSFTVAGDGSTNTVQTNSSTQYQNGSSVKTNDSVVVFGTTNNGTFTASSVVINP